MAKGVQPIRDGYRGMTPYLCVKGASEAIEFYTRAFGAEEVMRVTGPGGVVGHAELKIGDGMVMLADEHPDMGFTGPRTLGGSPVVIHLYVPDVDAFVRRAIDAGATALRPLADQFYGDRACKLEDPFGHIWNFATHIEDVSPEEIQRRADAMYGG